jgi:hypothetical protein
MIDNLKTIIPLLTFKNDGDFYMVHILRRKKDGSADNKHQSVRTIKTYCIESHRYLEEKMKEIRSLCELFGARAYISINRKNHADVAINMIAEIANRIKSNQMNQRNVFDSVVGRMVGLDKRFIVDIDGPVDVDKIIGIVNGVRPIGDKVKEVITTKNGVHLITDRFDVMEFNSKLQPEDDISIHKNNPTLLYYPTSLNKS